MEDIGARIRSLRENRSMTLREVSEKTGLSIGFLSQIERNIADASIASLKNIAEAFDLKISYFFENTPKKTNLVKKNERSRLYMENAKATYELLAYQVESRIMEPIYKILKPGSFSGVIDGHEGEEFLIMLQGQLEIQVGDEVNLVEGGDSFYFSANQPHSYRNTGDIDAICVWVVTPPTFN
ncbi:MAG: XRE family transcriptional regulator [Clostridiales bacterium]